MRDGYRQGIENTYFGALVSLGDKRIAAELARRGAAETHPRMRWNWALAGHWLGDSKPLVALADEFRSGKIVPPAEPAKPETGKGDGKPEAGKGEADKGKPRASRELAKIVGVLVSVELPEADR